MTIHSTPYRCPICDDKLEILKNRKLSIYCPGCDRDTPVVAKTVDEVLAGMAEAERAKGRITEEQAAERQREALRKEAQWFSRSSFTLVG